MPSRLSESCRIGCRSSSSRRRPRRRRGRREAQRSGDPVVALDRDRHARCRRRRSCSPAPRSCPSPWSAELVDASSGRRAAARAARSACRRAACRRSRSRRGHRRRGRTPPSMPWLIGERRRRARRWSTCACCVTTSGRRAAPRKRRRRSRRSRLRCRSRTGRRRATRGLRCRARRRRRRADATWRLGVERDLDDWRSRSGIAHSTPRSSIVRSDMPGGAGDARPHRTASRAAS